MFLPLAGAKQKGDRRALLPGSWGLGERTDCTRGTGGSGTRFPLRASRFRRRFRKAFRGFRECLHSWLLLLLLLDSRKFVHRDAVLHRRSISILFLSLYRSFFRLFVFNSDRDRILGISKGPSALRAAPGGFVPINFSNLSERVIVSRDSVSILRFACAQSDHGERCSRHRRDFPGV